jgi:hypothetical protein
VALCQGHTARQCHENAFRPGTSPLHVCLSPSRRRAGFWAAGLPYVTCGSSAGGTCSRNKMRGPIVRRFGWAAFSIVRCLSMPLCCQYGKRGFRVTAACGGEAGAMQEHGHMKRFRRRAVAGDNSEQDRSQATFARKSCVTSGRSPTGLVEGEGER